MNHIVLGLITAILALSACRTTSNEVGANTYGKPESPQVITAKSTSISLSNRILGAQSVSVVPIKRKKGLPRGGLTLQTLDSLGVALSQ